MANFYTLPVIRDTGSEEVSQIVTNYNNLLTVLGDLITALKTAADTAAINALATTAETALVASVKKLTPQPNIPAAPTRPSY